MMGWGRGVQPETIIVSFRDVWRESFVPGSITTKHDSLGFTKDSMSYEYIYIYFSFLCGNCHRLT